MERFNLWSRLLNITSSYTPLDSIFFLNTSFIFRYFLSSFPAYLCLKFLFSFPFNNMLFSSLPSILFLFRLYVPLFILTKFLAYLKKEVIFIFFHCSLSIPCFVFLPSFIFSSLFYFFITFHSFSRLFSFCWSGYKNLSFVPGLFCAKMLRS